MIRHLLCIVVSLLLIGCSDATGSKDSGYLHAFDDAYKCITNRTDHKDAAILSYESPVSLSKMVSALPDGLFWLEGVDEQGEKKVDSVLIGETGWMHDGVKNGNSVDIRCVLQEATDKNLSGKCRRWQVQSKTTVKVDPRTDEYVSMDELSCSYHTSEFSFPIDSTGVVYNSESGWCIGGIEWDLEDSLAANPPTVAVTMNDSIVEIKILDAQITWTKRPGL